MWIRTQNKNELVKCSYFEIGKRELPPIYTSDKKTRIINPFDEIDLEKFKTENDVEILDIKLKRQMSPIGYNNAAIIYYREIQKQYKYTIKTSDCVLGLYSTKEKALKVLDEIMSWINGLEYAKTTKSCRSTYVYQMPQDEKVKQDERLD